MLRILITLSYLLCIVSLTDPFLQTQLQECTLNKIHLTTKEPNTVTCDTNGQLVK